MRVKLDSISLLAELISWNFEQLEFTIFKATLSLAVYCVLELSVSIIF